MNLRFPRPDVPTMVFSVIFSAMALLAVCTASGVFGKGPRVLFRAFFGVTTERSMNPYFNVSAGVRPVGDKRKPVLTINGRTWAAPQDLGTHAEASRAALAKIEQLAAAAEAELSAGGWVCDGDYSA